MPPRAAPHFGGASGAAMPESKFGRGRAYATAGNLPNKLIRLLPIYRYESGKPVRNRDAPTIGGSEEHEGWVDLPCRCGRSPRPCSPGTSRKGARRMSSQIDHLLNESRRFAPPETSPRKRSRRPSCTSAPQPTARGSGPSRHASCTGTRRSPRSSTGRIRRSPSGSATASSTSPTTAWTATSRPATAIASRSSGRASRATTRRVTYAELTDEVKRLANVLEGLGIGEGDRVAIYMPMIPEAIAAMLAVARIGAIHSVVFGGFSADSLRSRIDDAGAKARHHGRRRLPQGQGLAPQARGRHGPGDRNGSGMQETVEHVLVVRRGENDVEWTEGRDIWWHDVVPPAAADHEARAFPAENRCSSSTPPGRPESRRASCTRRAATSRRRPSRTRSCTTSTPSPTCSGARPTSAGSPGTPT